MLQCAAVCCSVLQCAAVCCSVLQCAAVCCSVLQCAAVCCSVLQCAAVCCSVLQCAAVFCSVFQCVAVYVGVFQCTQKPRYKLPKISSLLNLVYQTATGLTFEWKKQQEEFDQDPLCYSGDVRNRIAEQV